MSDQEPIQRNISEIVADVLRNRREAHEAQYAVKVSERELMDAMDREGIHIGADALACTFAYNEAKKNWETSRFIISRDDASVFIRCIREVK